MGLLSSLYEWKGGLMGKQDAARYKALEASGVNDLMMKREQMAADAAAQSKMKVQAGLLKPLLERFGPDAAKQIGSGLLSDSPEARAQAGELYYKGREGLGLLSTPEQQRQQAAALGISEKAQQLTLGQQTGPLQVEALKANIRQSNMAAEASQAQIQNLRQKGLAPGDIFEAMFGSKVPPGYRPLFNQSTGEVSLRPIEGGDPYKKDFEGVRLAEAALTRAQSLSDDFREYGTEQLPTAAKGRMKATRGSVMADLGQLQQLGVLQPADVERLSSMLPDPTETTFIQTDAEAAAAYDFVEQELERALRNAYESKPWIPRGQVSLPGSSGASGKY